MSELAKALAQVQANLPAIHKTQTANVKMKAGGVYSYKYVDLAEISAQVLPLLAQAGLSWLTMPTLDGMDRFVLQYELLHSSGESRSGTYPLTAGTHQETGSAITYARRYCLCAVVGVAPDEDDDGAAAARAQRAQRERAETMRWVSRIATGLLTVDTHERAAKGMNTVEDSGLGQTDVSGLLTDDDRLTLGIAAGTQLTLWQLAASVSAYVATHNGPVRRPPEATKPEPPAEPATKQKDTEPGLDKPATPAQIKKLHTLLSKAELKDRDDKLKFISVNIHRNVASTNELNQLEAHTMIEGLQEWDNDENASIAENMDAWWVEYEAGKFGTTTEVTRNA